MKSETEYEKEKLQRENDAAKVQEAHRQRGMDVQLNTKRIRVMLQGIYAIIIIRFIFWALNGVMELASLSL